MFLKKVVNSIFKKNEDNSDFEDFLNSYKSYCNNHYSGNFEHDFQRSLEMKNNQKLESSEQMETEEKHTLKISYAKGDFFGTLKIFHYDEHVYGGNIPVWYMKYFNLLKDSQKEQLLRIVYDFTMFEGAEKILENSWCMDADTSDRINNSLNYKKNMDVNREKDFETRLNLIQKVLDHPDKKCNNVFLFLLIATILRTNASLSENIVNIILNNPYNYDSLSSEDKRKLSIFNVLLPVLIIDDSQGVMNNFFVESSNKDIEVLYSLIGKVVYDKAYPWTQNKNVFAHRTDKIFRNELNYIFHTSEVIANYVNARNIGYSYKEYFSTTKASNFLNLPNRMYSLIFSQVYKEPYYLPESKDVSSLFEDEEYIDELHSLMNNLQCDEFCSNHVSDSFKKSIRKLFDMFDLDLLSHLLNHDEDKLLEVVKFLENDASRFMSNSGQYVSSYEQQKYYFVDVKRYHEYTTKFKYSFLISVLQWGMNDYVPFSLWMNLNEKEMV